MAKQPRPGRSPKKGRTKRRASPPRVAGASKRQPPAAMTARRPSPPKASAPRGLGGEQVEGRQAVRELLLAGRRRVHEVWIAADDDDRRGPLSDIADIAADGRVVVKRVSPGKLAAAARSEAPQGVLARAAPLEEVDFDELCRTGRDGRPPFLVAVDGVTDPGNLGAVLRSAECAGATGAVLPKHRSAHVTPTVAKAAAGAIEHVPMALVPGLPNALARAKELGLWVVGLDSGGTQRIDQVTLAAEPVVLVFGAEGRGLAPLVRRRCDVVAAIPLQGRLGSLNVAAAAAIATYEVARRRLDAV